MNRKYYKQLNNQSAVFILASVIGAIISYSIVALFLSGCCLPGVDCAKPVPWRSATDMQKVGVK